MYIWGGFSYTPLTEQELQEYKNKCIQLPNKSNIYSYSDGLCITYNNNNLNYNNIPMIPYPLVGFGIVNYEDYNKIFFINGCVYDRESFNTFNLINNICVGSSFFSMLYDNNNNIIPNSTEFINNFPGSPRYSSNTHIINNFIYILNGINTTSDKKNNFKGYREYTYNNVIDNWKYDIINNKWIRIKDYPIPMCNQGSVVYQNRYIILFGGIKYNTTYTFDKKIINTNTIIYDTKLPYNNISTIKNDFITPESTANQYNRYFSNIIIIYDTIEDKYTLSDTKLPININAPKVISYCDDIYIIGGEGNPTLIDGIYYGNCLSLMLKINIK